MGVAEGLLPAQHGLVIGPLGVGAGQVLDVDQVLAQPVGVGALGGEAALQLVVADDPPGGGVDEQHLARPQPVLQHDLVGRHVEHAGLGGEDHAVVGGDAVARRPQAVAVEHRADRVPSVKAIDAGPSHGSISDEWYS